MSEQLSPSATVRAACARSLQIMADGNLADFEAVIHRDAVNREASGPPATRESGPAAFHAIALWLRGAFCDLRWDIDQVAADQDRRGDGEWVAASELGDEARDAR